MQTNKILMIVFGAVIAVSLVISGIAFFQEPPLPEPVEVPVTVTVPPSPELTVVKAPDQTEVTLPAGFTDPEENTVKMPETENLAEGKTVQSGAITDIYVAQNAVDGDPLTYWESAGFPAEYTIDLAGVYAVKTVGLRLNPAAIWAARNQAFAILGSTDGVTFETIVPEASYAFDPETGNAVRVDFDAAEAQFIRLVFSSNTAAESGTTGAGSQAGEIMVFE
ncbi:MAG: discoidin domain-containing protein [Oscillospiraceae bacterium]|jgi:hypothetical protein|nr:discoidin domain-containing protein [Oscillospiraceae bacterium]